MNRLNFKEIDQPLQARLLASSPSVGIQARKVVRGLNLFAVPSGADQEEGVSEEPYASADLHVLVAYPRGLITSFGEGMTSTVTSVVVPPHLKLY